MLQLTVAIFIFYQSLKGAEGVDLGIVRDVKSSKKTHVLSSHCNVYQAAAAYTLSTPNHAYIISCLHFYIEGLHHPQIPDVEQ